jgi:hypothetical protein
MESLCESDADFVFEIDEVFYREIVDFWIRFCDYLSFLSPSLHSRALSILESLSCRKTTIQREILLFTKNSSALMSSHCDPMRSDDFPIAANADSTHLFFSNVNFSIRNNLFLDRDDDAEELLAHALTHLKINEQRHDSFLTSQYSSTVALFLFKRGEYARALNAVMTSLGLLKQKVSFWTPISGSSTKDKKEMCDDFSSTTASSLHSWMDVGGVSSWSILKEVLFMFHLLESLYLSLGHAERAAYFHEKETILCAKLHLSYSSLVSCQRWSRFDFIRQWKVRDLERDVDLAIDILRERDEDGDSVLQCAYLTLKGEILLSNFSSSHKNPVADSLLAFSESIRLAKKYCESNNAVTLHDVLYPLKHHDDVSIESIIHSYVTFRPKETQNPKVGFPLYFYDRNFVEISVFARIGRAVAASKSMNWIKANKEIMYLLQYRDKLSPTLLSWCLIHVTCIGSLQIQQKCDSPLSREKCDSRVTAKGVSQSKVRERRKILSTSDETERIRSVAVERECDDSVTSVTSSFASMSVSGRVTKKSLLQEKECVTPVVVTLKNDEDRLKEFYGVISRSLAPLWSFLKTFGSPYLVETVGKILSLSASWIGQNEISFRYLSESIGMVPNSQKSLQKLRVELKSDCSEGKKPLNSHDLSSLSRFFVSLSLKESSSSLSIGDVNSPDCNEVLETPRKGRAGRGRERGGKSSRGRGRGRGSPCDPEVPTVTVDRSDDNLTREDVTLPWTVCVITLDLEGNHLLFARKSAPTPNVEVVPCISFAKIPMKPFGREEGERESSFQRGRGIFRDIIERSKETNAAANTPQVRDTHIHNRE